MISLFIWIQNVYPLKMIQELCNKQKRFYNHIISVSFNFATFFPEIILQFVSLKIMNYEIKSYTGTSNFRFTCFLQSFIQYLPLFIGKLYLNIHSIQIPSLFLMTIVNFNFLIWAFFPLYKDLATTHCDAEKESNHIPEEKQVHTLGSHRKHCSSFTVHGLLSGNGHCIVAYFTHATI
jgi:hypothetical protein